jgi:hypothetical protein
VPEIVPDPEMPGPARRELEQTPLSALPGFSSPCPSQEPDGRVGASGVGSTAMSARFVAGGSLALAVLLSCLGLLGAQPDLVLAAIFFCLPCAAVSALIGFSDPSPGQEAQAGRSAAQRTAMAYHRPGTRPA